MSWQDVVLAAGGFVIAAGIIPTILGRVKPALLTSVTIVAVLGVSTVAFATLGLWLTAAGTALQFVLWSIVVSQTVAARRSTPVPLLGDALTLPVDTAPALGFAEFVEEPPAEGATAG